MEEILTDLCIEGEITEIEVDNKTYESTVLTVYSGTQIVFEAEIIGTEEKPAVNFYE